MKTDYKKLFKPVKKVKQPTITETTVDMPIVVKVPIQKVEVPVLKEAPRSYPEIQAVKIVNPQKAPEVQKVEVTNHQEQQKIEIPDSIKVNNADELAQKIADKIVIPSKIKAEVTNQPEIQKLPISKGNKPGSADPSSYVPVRLTDGEHFIQGLGDQFVAAAKTTFPYINKTTGKPQAATVDDLGVVQTNAGTPTITTTSGQPLFVFPVNLPTTQQVFVTNPSQATVTTTSGLPLDVTVRNIPTVQTVQLNSPFVQVTPGVTTAVSGNITTTTTSGLPGLNFPTVQTVNVQNLPAVSVSNFPANQTVNGTVTTASGSAVDVKNFPTVMTVNVANMPVVTTVSGTVELINDLTTLAVSGTVTANQGGNWSSRTQDGSGNNITSTGNALDINIKSGNPTTITTLSGSATDVKNFPTIQTVNVQNMPSVTVGNFPASQAVTTASGFHATIDNFPTYQTVNVQNIPTVTVNNPTAANLKVDLSATAANATAIKVDGSGVTQPVSGNVTTLSGSIVDVKNFPTVQTVNVNNAPNVQITPGITTAVSGSLSLVTTSGSPMNSFITNIPTVQSVFVTNPSQATVTTTSGSPLDVTVRNFPTVQTVNVQSMPSIQVTTASGQPGLNFPTVQTVQPQGITTISGQAGVTLAVSGTVTTTSGFHTTIDNFPTIQKVSIADLPSINVSTLPNITTASGFHVTLDNFPTYQTVNVQNLPNVTIGNSPSVTTLSGSIVDVKNFPTIQTVQTSGVTTISGQAGVTLAVSGTVTTTSGFHTTIDNFPTIQKVSVADLPSITVGNNITTASGSVVDVKNFPTYQSVLANVQYLNGTAIDTNSGNKSAGTQRVVLATDQPNLTTPLNVTTASGFQVDVKNFPTFHDVISPTAGNFLNVAYDTTDAINSGSTSLTPLFAPIVASSAGMQTVISGVATKQIRVLEWGLTSNGTVNADWRSGASAQQLTGRLFEIANTGFSSGYSPKGHFQTVAGEALALNLSAAISVEGYLVYITV